MYTLSYSLNLVFVSTENQQGLPEWQCFGANCTVRADVSRGDSSGLGGEKYLLDRHRKEATDRSGSPGWIVPTGHHLERPGVTPSPGGQSSRWVTKVQCFLWSEEYLIVVGFESHYYVFIFFQNLLLIYLM